MRRLVIALVGAFLLASCSGVIIGDPESEVATFQLRADQLGALLARGCVSRYGEAGCSRYPNPLECDVMVVTVMGDGRTCSICKGGGRTIASVCGRGSVADGVPFLCHAKPDLSCQQCVDLFGNTVLDNCNRGAQLFRAPGGGWNLDPEKSGVLLEDDPGDQPQDPPAGDQPQDPPPQDQPQDPPVGDQPQDPPADKPPSCDPQQARLLFAKQLNAILKQEGVQLSYSPDLGQKYNTGSGYWGYSGYGNKSDTCKQWLTSNSQLTQCWVNEGGRCHCKGASGTQQSCKCSRINVFALRAACQQIPAGCDYNSWVAGIVMEYGVATQWLFNGTYNNGYYGGLPSTPGGSSGIAPKCLGSPLVLDLEGDGVRPTSVDAGVKFDLLGHGPMRTAWLDGDDAFLAMDRNNNGIIDDGTELFGTATDIGGVPAPDGFSALAVLDEPSQGGNGNGLMDEEDLMFGQLRLWSDGNRDGVCQPGELRDLPRAGIHAIDVTSSSAVPITDDHGNDLSLRGSFARRDGGQGLVVDVFFRVGR